jgi:PKD repeat protein
VRVPIRILFLCVVAVFFVAVTSQAHIYLGPESEKEEVHTHKGEHNPHPGWYPGELDELGGPDAAGYIFRDSSEPDGPTYTWVEMSVTGNELSTLADDGYAGPFPLPWSFSYYGDVYDELWICSNGYLMFDGGNTSYDNTPIPDGSEPNNMIALFWDDLNPASGGTVYYGADGPDRIVVQYDAIREYGGNGTITAEIILDSDGTITMQYQSLANGIDINGETIGIENANGSIGLMVALDSSPANYPYNSLAIEFTQLTPNASISGFVTDSGTGDPIDGATVDFGGISATSNPDGSYSIPEIFAGDYDVTVSANGYFDHYAAAVTVVEGANLFDYMLDPSGMPSGFVGAWTFDDPGNLTAASVGNDLILSGSHSAISGPEPGDGAVRIGQGSFYRCYHDIEANGAFGNPSWVNQFTIVMDVRIPQTGQWYCFYQTNANNANDGDWFANTSGNVGVGDTGYSEYALVPGEWYRLAISVDLGVQYNYYLDGQLLQVGGAQGFEGRFALYPADAANQVLFFADNNGEDNAVDVAQIQLYDRALSSAEMASLDGYGHEFEGPVVRYMAPFLQTPTPNSLYVCWHSDASTESIVEYGTTPDLGSQQSGDHHQFNVSTIWHWVQLDGLAPQTTYYYKVVSDTAESEIYAFTTQQPDGNDQEHVRFSLYSDPQTTEMHRNVVNALRDKLVELYGEDYHQDVQLAMLTGDIVNTGSNLSQYQPLFFDNIAAISSNLPVMNTLGNHEAEANTYYQYMLYDDFGGPEGEKYYSFWIGNVLFIGLNSNVRGNTQLNWLEDLLETAQNDPAIDWIFAFHHHPGHSETWPDGNTSWVQNEVIPMLASYSKVEQLCYGHTHAYERGATTDGNLRLLCFGGGGGHLDRWRMYNNQTNYPEIFKSHDYYGYTIFDVDPANDTYTATVYTLGHEDTPMDNVVLDSWFRDRNGTRPQRPTALGPSEVANTPSTLTASPFTAQYDIMSSQFQLNDTRDDWGSPIIDRKRDWVDIYWDTGAPNYTPIDQNEGIDLSRIRVPDEILTEGEIYYWRVRYRDQNLLWSAWSRVARFEVTWTPTAAAFTADTTHGGVHTTVRFTDLSNGEPDAWAWDLDGDGDIDSQERDPVFTYDEPGTYTVTLISRIDGAEHTVTRADYVTITSTSAKEETALPLDFEVGECYPNPFNAETVVSISLPRQTQLTVAVYNLIGQQVLTLADDSFSAGIHNLSINGSQLSSGVYFIHVAADGYLSQVRKVVLLK